MIDAPKWALPLSNSSSRMEINRTMNEWELFLFIYSFVLVKMNRIFKKFSDRKIKTMENHKN